MATGRIESLSRFEIEAVNLEFEVTAKNWFLQELLSRGYTLEGLRSYSDKRAEAVYVLVEGDTSYIVRSLAEINGPRMIVASYYIPFQFFAEERAWQQRAIDSFRFVSPEKSKIELTRTYAFLDLLKFDYPASWRLVSPTINGIEGMEAKLIHSVDSKTLGGEIHISIISKDYEYALLDEVNYLKEEMKSRGLHIGDLLVMKDDYQLPDHVKYNHTEIYRAYDKQKQVTEHEYWVSIMEEDRYFYIVTMITPGRRGEFYEWARNAEVFETVVQGFRE